MPKDALYRRVKMELKIATPQNVHEKHFGAFKRVQSDTQEDELVHSIKYNK